MQASFCCEHTCDAAPHSKCLFKAKLKACELQRICQKLIGTCMLIQACVAFLESLEMEEDGHALAQVPVG